MRGSAPRPGGGNNFPRTPLFPSCSFAASTGRGSGKRVCRFNDVYVKAANEFLEDQLLFGSTYPVASFESVLEGYRNAPFRPEVLEKVLYTNACRLYGFTK